MKTIKKIAQESAKKALGNKKMPKSVSTMLKRQIKELSE